MITLLVVVVLALAAGLARGGSIDALASTRARWVSLIFAGLVLQTALDLWDPPWLSSSTGLIVVIASNLLVAAFLVLNNGLPGAWIAGCGLALNVIVVAANGAMPVAPEAAQAGGAEIARRGSIKHEAMGPSTALPWLGDVLPVPVFREVLSAGDILLTAGIGRLVYKRTAEGRQRGRHRAEQA